MHYLDDFLLVQPCKDYLRLHTGRAVGVLQEAAFLVSHRSVMEPSPEVVFLGENVAQLERNLGGATVYGGAPCAVPVLTPFHYSRNPCW